MLVVLGSNHRSAPVALRERLAFEEHKVPDLLEELTAAEGIEEAMILSTCNRVEILARATSSHGDGLETLKDFIAERQGLSRKELERYSYQLRGREVVRHLFRVTAGLDSMILGEPQILGQVKQAYRMAKDRRATGPVLDRMLQHAFGAAKRVRTETAIAKNAVSVAYAAVELARKIFGKLGERSALLLGAGKMGDLLALHLASQGVSELIVASRTYNRAVEAAERFGGRAVNWDDGLSQLGRVDIVVSCTGAPRQILSKEQVATARRQRRSRPLFLIDIAVPRDIDPKANELDNVYLYDIDALQGVIESNLEERRRAAEQAELLIEDEVEAFNRWRQSQGITPLIVSLRESMLGMGRREVERFRRKLGPLTDTQSRAMEELTRAVIQKMLHRPIRHLRQSVDRGEAESCARLYCEIFNLDPRQPAASGEPPAEETGERPGRAPGPQRLLRGGRDE